MHSKTQQKRSLSSQTLQARLRIQDHTRSNRKHWDLYRYLLNTSVLADALESVMANAGAGGVDDIKASDIKGRESDFIKSLEEKLRHKTYRPRPVRRVHIPKANGKMRPLGIPTLEDRVVQKALVLLLEPIYEEIFCDFSFGFRPGRRAVDCAAEVANTAFRHRHVIDADIESFFDSVVHRKLVGMLKEQIVDPRILDLIKMFLQAGFQEPQKPWQPTQLGTPQGGPLSPLLANIYLHHALDTRFKSMGSKSAKLIRYADDFVILTKTKSEAQSFLSNVESWLKEAGLSLSPEKTKLINLKNRYRDEKSKFNFLGFKFHLRAFKDNPKRFWVARQPSEKSRSNLRQNVKQVLKPNASPEKTKQMVKSIWLGWCEYFRYANANRVFYKEIVNVRKLVFVLYLRRKYRNQRRPVPWRRLQKLGVWMTAELRPLRVIPDLVRQRNKQLELAVT